MVPPPVHRVRRRPWWPIALGAVVFLALVLVMASRLRPARIARINYASPALQAASRRAKDELGTFIKALETRTATQRFFIRGAFPTDAGPEYLWVRNVTYDRGEFRGTLDERPVVFRGAQKGEEVVVKRQDVFDWAIKDGDTIRGRYTEAVLGGG
jgi:uncharacterized protein YegJ (DUF2314 family)